MPDSKIFNTKFNTCLSIISVICAELKKYTSNKNAAIAKSIILNYTSLFHVFLSILLQRDQEGNDTKFNDLHKVIINLSELIKTSFDGPINDKIKKIVLNSFEIGSFGREESYINDILVKLTV